MFTLAVFLFSYQNVFSQVVINEINPSKEWVELYNLNQEIVTLENCILYMDGNDFRQKVIFSNQDEIVKFKVVNSGGTWLNNKGDNVRLECRDYEDRVSYGNDVKDKSYGRLPDGIGPFYILEPSEGATNSLTSTPSAFLTPTPTSTSTPSSLPKAIYKINEVKDKNGSVLSSVKIYIDGAYIHHYTPETLVFCDGCKCDTYVDCGFGSHTIGLQKTGYLDWNEEINIKSGDILEVSPVMEEEESNLLTPTPTPTPTPKSPLTPTPTPTLKITPTEATRSGEVLGEEEEATVGGFYPLEATEEADKIEEATSEGKRNNKNKILRGVFIGAGLLALFGAAFSLWYTKLK